MIKLSQRDERWKDKKLGNSNSSIGSYGCLVTALSMLAGITPDEFNTRLTNVNGYQVDLVLWQKIKDAVSWLEFEWRGYSYDNDKVKEAIKKYKGCLVEVDYDGKISTPKDKHWVLYIGNGKMYDPWTGRECSTSKYPRVTGYSIIKVYTKPEEPQMAENLIIKFLKEKGKYTEGDVREMYGALDDLGKVKELLRASQTLVKSLESRIKELDDKVKAEKQKVDNWHSLSSSATKRAEKSEGKLEAETKQKNNYKRWYEKSLENDVAKLKPSKLFSYWFRKVFNVPEKVQP